MQRPLISRIRVRKINGKQKMKASPSDNITHERISSYFFPSMNDYETDEKTVMGSTMLLGFLFLINGIKNWYLFGTADFLLLFSIEYFYLYSTIILPFKFITRNFNFPEFPYLPNLRFHSRNSLPIFNSLYYKINIVPECKIS